MTKLFTGTFNFHGETSVIYRYAKSERQAWSLMCRRLAKKHGVLPIVMTGYFNGEKNNYKVEREVK